MNLKIEFISQKGNFGEGIIIKIFVKKLLHHLCELIIINNNKLNWFKNYEINSRETLQNKLNNALPISFICTSNKQLLFIIHNSNVIEFILNDWVDV